jgi:hypothetical protein
MLGALFHPTGTEPGLSSKEKFELCEIEQKSGRN